MGKEVANSTKFYRKRVAKGLCPYCGNPVDGAIRCRSCQDKENKRRREEHEWYLSNGICPICKKRDIEPNKRRCFECGERERILQRKRVYKDRDKFLAKNREYQKTYYQKRKESGICTRCKNKADPGYTTCARCRTLKVNAYKKKAPMKRTDRWKLGLCFFCDEKVKEGYKVCEKHWKMNCEKSKLCPKETKKRITNYIWGRESRCDANVKDAKKDT